MTPSRADTRRYPAFPNVEYRQDIDIGQAKGVDQTFLDVDVSIQSVQGLWFHKGISDFDVLLGRDIIYRGTFSLSFDGHFTLSI